MNFYEGQILLIDKPVGWTSFDVVNKTRIAIKNKFGKKIKVGHAGTLDPLASGLLILCTGNYTKKISDFSKLDKKYIATITFGATTPSFDKETPIDQYYPFEHIDYEFLTVTLKKFIGKQQQIPPIYSAKKVHGQKLYEFARNGIKIDLKPHEIEIYEIKILEHQLPKQVTLLLHVSKGTYIRSFANDLGKALNSGAYLENLRRIAIGNFVVENALSLHQIIDMINQM